MSLRLRLRPDFRLNHQPLDGGSNGVVLGGLDLARRLTDRLEHSDGGSFLITGLRGTGKTTTLRRALADWRVDNSSEHIVDVHLVLARPLDEEALLFEIIRRLFEELTRRELLSELPAEVRESLLVSYARTSFSQKRTTSATRERDSSLQLGGSLGLGKGVSLPLPKQTFGRKSAETKATELSFLAYSRSDAEHDFLRILGLLGAPHARRRGRLRTAWEWLTRQSVEPLRLRIVIALDEVDKLTGAEDGQDAFERLLSALKNTFSTRNVHVVIVAGIDQHDRWLDEAATTDSLYRSIFAWHAYQPCLWDHADPLVRGNVAAGEPEADIDALACYLEFRGRGIVRALLAEFNELVEWHDGAPVVELDDVAEQRVRLVADVQRAMREPLGALARATVLASPATEDRWRLAAYYAVDWVLRTNGQPFVVADVVVGLGGRPRAEDDTEQVDRLETLLGGLVDAQILDRADRDAVSVTIGGVDDKAPRTQYWLEAAFLDRLHRIVEGDPRSRAEILAVGTDADARNPVLEEAQREAGEKYAVEQTIAAGPHASVYIARDRASDTPVVLKLARYRNAASSRRLAGEAELLRRLEHPNVVKLLDALPNGFAMPLIPGANLAQVADQHRLEPGEVLAIGVQLLDATAYLASQNVRHLDIKPSNIVLGPTGEAVLIDLGSASQALLSTADADVFFGTPKWAAPERRGGIRADDRSDMYSIALVLAELLGIGAAGKPDPAGIVEQYGACSSELRAALARALAPDPQTRFASAEEMREALLLVPEYEPRRF